jgi:ATP-binding cassette subfamily B protein
MFNFYWKLALILLAVIPFYFLLYMTSNRLNKKMVRKMMERSAALETQLVESLQAVSTIKRFGLENFSNEKMEGKFIRLLETIFAAGTNAIRLGNINELISRLLTIVILWAGSYYVIQRQLTPGELLSFYTLIGYFTGPASTLIGMNRNMQDALVAADRLFEIMDLEREENLNKMELNRLMVSVIRFKNVSFRYGSGPVVFQNIDLVLPAGKITAVVGESGSGKSTLMSLLQNVYQPTEGNIYIGDYDIRHISNDSLRQLIGVVPQQVDLFAGNFIENIAVGDYNPDLQKINRLCNAISISGFIETLPAGLYSSLGENGVNLSGGQRQRIAIARALYRDPEVLILDEATSSLDAGSEQYVQAIIQ